MGRHERDVIRSITIIERGVICEPAAYGMYWVKLFNENDELTDNKILTVPLDRLRREGVELNVDDKVLVAICTRDNGKGTILDIAG